MDTGLIDQSIIDTARAKQGAAWRSVCAARDDQAAANEALAAAMTQREGLVTAAAAGQPVAPADLRKAEDAARAAEAAAAFARDVERARLVTFRQADHELNEAPALAAIPMADAGARLLLAAAKRHDEAVAAVKAIEAEMDAAASIINDAKGRGCRLRHGIAAKAEPWGHPVKLPVYLTAAEVQRDLASAGLKADAIAS